MRGNLQQWVKKLGFDKRQHYTNNKSTTDKPSSIGTLKLSTLLPQVTYILILIVNDKK